MPESVRDVLKMYRASKTIRRNWESMWREAYDYTLPQRPRFYYDDVQTTEGEKRTHEIYDETAVVGLPAFASRTLNGLFPPLANAFNLVPGPQLLAKMNKAELKDLQTKLDKVTEIMHEAIWNSNFHSEAHEAFIDLGIGTGNLEVRPGDFPGDIFFKAIQLHELTILPGPDDMPRAWFRTHRMSLADVRRKWPKAEFTQFMEQQLKQEQSRGDDEGKETKDTVVEAVYRDFSAKGDVKFIYQVIHEKHKHIMLEQSMQGLGSQPVITFRWSKASGEVYGRGPILQVMPAIRTVNETVKLVLENAQIAIGGAFTYDDDGVFEPENITIQPGTFIPKAPGSEIAPLQTGAKFDVSDLVLSDQRRNIRKALFIDELEREAKTPLSATEVAERTAEVARTIGAVAGRLRHEFLTVLVQRVAFILQRQGVIDIPRIDNKQIKLVPRSPLLRAQNQQDINDFLRFQEAIAFVAGEMAPLQTNVQRASQYLAEKFGIDQRLLNTDNEKQQALENMQAIAQQTQIAPSGGGGAQGS